MLNYHFIITILHFSLQGLEPWLLGYFRHQWSVSKCVNSLSQNQLWKILLSPFVHLIFFCRFQSPFWKLHYSLLPYCTLTRKDCPSPTQFYEPTNDPLTLEKIILKCINCLQLNVILPPTIHSIKHWHVFEILLKLDIDPLYCGFFLHFAWH
jgi:hypothetical protein